MLTNSSDDEGENGLDYVLLFRLIVWGYAGLILSLFGIVGNIITILVLTSSSMRTTSTNIYLTALSCSNIFFLLIFIPSYSIRYLLGYKVYMSNQPPFAFEILLQRLPTTPIYNTILLSIIYLTIAVSMDRLILIKFPLRAKDILTKRATLITISLIYIFSIVYCIPYWLEQRYIPELKQCRLTKIGTKIHKYTRIYIYIPVVYVIPFVTLTFINIKIIQYLIEKNRQRQNIFGKTKRRKSADYHITLMLVTVIIVFVLSQLPLLVLNAWYAIDPHGSYESLKFHTLNSIGVLLIVLNTSTNFLLYCFFGQKFRQTLIKFIINHFPKRSKKLQQHPRNQKPNRLSSEKPKRISRAPFSIIPNDSRQNKIKTYDLDHTTFNEPSSPLDQIPFITFKEESRLLLPYTLIQINEQDRSELNPQRSSLEDENRLLVLKA
jgi:neuropeptide Y receptor type 1